MQAVEGICLEEGKKRDSNSLLEHRSYDSVQRQQREKLVENEHDPLCEDTYGGITSQFCDLECGEDSNWRTEDQMHQVETSIEIARNMQLESVSVLDYRSILRTQAKSYMRAHLEDLPEKDATGMFEAANRVLNQLLIEMDGMAAKKTVLIIGTTNMPDIINPELPSLRCLDQLIYKPFPDKASHLQIFKACWRKPRVPKNVDLIVRAQYTRVFIGANITQICLRACKYTTWRKYRRTAKENLP
ncbi:hypothetical protein NC652_009114 [Populus alba x Populus x berolinensis]|nr:hypothetical protein NC652_009114 [Populus alba x Populus x berolinensis]